MIKTRFAPSPTGYLHIGGLRTALFNYLYARARGGEFILRIEDTDFKRNSEEATKAILEAFKWCSLECDGEIYYQSKRMDIYKKYLKKLLDEDKAYYCYMSKEELDALRKEQMLKKQRPKYNAKYRDYKGEIPADISPVIRIKAPLKGEIIVKDGVKGEISFKAEDILDDFIIARADGSPTYNFVVVVDDALMGITDIIRGDDHLSNTPKQIVLYEALGFDIPRFFHTAMVNAQNGKKLSKREGALDVMEYKREGFLAPALLNFLVRLGWGYEDEEIFSLERLKELFDPYKLSKSTSIYNLSKLEWLNAHYIKSLSFEEINKEIKELGFDFTNKEKLLELLRQRAKNLCELINTAKSIEDRPLSYDGKAVKKVVKVKSQAILAKYLKELKKRKTALEYEQDCQVFLDKEGLKLKELAQLLRIAITGKGVSPGIFEVLELLDFEELKIRLENFLLFLDTKNF